MKIAVAVTFAVLGAVSLQAGLVHQYDFTSGITDLVGSENGSTFGGAVVEGGVLSVDGQVGSFAEFDSHIVPTSGSFTVALDFMLMGAQGGSVELISQGFTSQGFFLGKGNGFSAGPGIRATDFWLNTGATFPTDQQWHSIALVSDAGASTLKLYLDGGLAASTTLGGPLTTTTSGSDTRLGAQFFVGDFADSENFFGNIDNLRIYDNALTDQQVTDLTATPEPSAFVLMGLGAIAVSRLRRRS